MESGGNIGKGLNKSLTQKRKKQMKKLMIVAAAAAMISGAYADMVFDFTAKVTTTAAKQGGATTQKMNVGRDALGNWWYETGPFTPNADPNWLDYNGTYFIEKAAKKDGTGVFKIQTNKFKTNDEKAALAQDLNLAGPFDQPEVYKGRTQWCFSFTYKVDGTCIRAKGSETIKSWFDDAGVGCCTATIKPDAALHLYEGIWDSKTKTYTSGAWLLGDMRIATLYRFGNVLGTKCNNIEAVGWIGDAGVGADAVDSDAALYKTIPNFAFAGQGTWGKNTAADKTSDDDAIQKLSGNIVGIWYEAECEVCCGADKSSLAWACDLSAHNIGGWIDSEFSIPGDDTFMGLQDFYGADQWGTAAFGTFTLTFNKAASSNL